MEGLIQVACVECYSVGYIFSVTGLGFAPDFILGSLSTCWWLMLVNLLSVLGLLLVMLGKLYKVPGIELGFPAYKTWSQPIDPPFHPFLRLYLCFQVFPT